MADQIREILVIHHSHTDVGYTAQQSIVARWNVDFIRQALSILERHPDFRWTCETFWGVEQFLGAATEDERAAFSGQVVSGKIGLSASYLNFNELLDYDILARMTSRAVTFGRSIGVSVDSAMTADINGFGWGFARAMDESGIANLFTCIHTHHGTFPLGGRHVAFWWETPGGKSILVFNGEHYHFGNELGLVPGAVASYIIKDECDAPMIFGDHWKVAELRVPRLVEQLTRSGYGLSFVPVMASGLRTDNGPPSEALLHCIERWNQEHSDLVTIHMVTLSEFFQRLRAHSSKLEIFRGDWPDWWSDGLSSFPADTALFREAQRGYHECCRLVEQGEINSDPLERMREELALYAEHTFGHADSVSRPWGLDVKGISSRKTAYAANGYDRVMSLLDSQCKRRGQRSLCCGVAPVYKVLNSWDRPVTGYAALFVSHYEYRELGFDKGMAVRSCSDGCVIPHQRRQAPTGMEFVVRVDLAARGELELEVTSESEHRPEYIEATPAGGIITPMTEIAWSVPDGISKWRDVASDRNLIWSGAAYPPFAPIYEQTPARGREDMCRIRSEMVLNRKGAEVVRTAGRLVRAFLEDDGPLFSRVSLDYALPGTSSWRAYLTAYKHQPRVDIVVQITKDQVWNPENVYLSLPFGPGSDNFTIWLDKSGAAVRPRIDQLPGTLIDFYCIQEGIAIHDRSYGVAIATPDTPLVHLGDLEYRDRILHAEQKSDTNQSELYSWLMTNYWETNFSAGLGGFYEFRFAVSWGEEYADLKTALYWCRAAFSGLRVVRVGR